MILGEFGKKQYSKSQQTGCVDYSLTGHLGVKFGGEITSTPSLDAHKHVVTLRIHPGFLQYTQPWKNYQNINSG